MSYAVDQASGGPYAHEIDAIRDERVRASVMDTKPDFHSVFKGVISQGAYAIIRDIDVPIELPVGPFIENVVDNDEEVIPEAVSEEASAPAVAETPAVVSPEVPATEPGNAPSDPAPVEAQPASIVDLQTVLDPVTPDNDTPIYVQTEADINASA